MNIRDLLLTSINAAIKAGYEIMKVYESDFDVENKEDNTPLTIADKKSNSVIEEELRASNIPYLSEEGKSILYQKRKDWKYLWIVDPLDGTKEFIKRNGEFTVNIALIKENKPIMGVIYVPCTKELYFSLEGIGSYKIEIDNCVKDLDNLIDLSARLPVSHERLEYVVVGSRSHMTKETKEYVDLMKLKKKEIRVLAIGSSLKICMVAEGRADSYPRYAPTMEWDTAAGHAIANMAGFKILEYNSSEEIVYNKESLLNPWFLVVKK
jgi:3'(2'), 5'-bisphosphate nucleotidase